jgi:hypothetical protein
MTKFKNREEYERWKAEKLKQAQEATTERKKYKKKQIGPFSIFYTSGEILRQTNNAKAWLYAILALLWSTIISFGPIAIGLWLLFEGEVLKAVLIPIALYLIIGFYMAFWPFIAILIFIGGWIEYGFLESLSGTIAFVVTVFVFLSGPEWLMYRSYRAAENAERLQYRIETMSQNGTDKDEVPSGFRKDKASTIRDFGGKALYTESMQSKRIKEKDIFEKIANLGKKRGVLTYDEINKVFPSEFFSPDELEDLMDILQDMGIKVVDSEESGKQPKTLLEQAQEVGGKLIIDGYRRIAAIKGCAPSSKTTDKEIIEIYSKVGSAFRQAAMQRGEIIPADNLNFIVWKFFQVYEMMGDEMLISHLQYEVEKYLQEGLRPEYRSELTLF